MRAVSEVEHLVGVWAVATKFAPAFGDDDTRATCFGSLEYDIGQSLWIVDHNTAEAHVDRGGPCAKECLEIRRTVVFRFVTQEKAAYIDFGSPIRGLRDEGWRPTVRVWNLQITGESRAHRSLQNVESESLSPPVVYEVAKSGMISVSVANTNEIVCNPTPTLATS
jgi:hypothetical protein